MRVASEKTQNHGNEIDKSALLSVAVHSEVWWGTQHADIAKSFVLIKMILLVSASRLTTGNWGRVDIEIFTFRTARTRPRWSWRLSPAPPWLRWRSRGRTPSISWASVYRTEWWDLRFYDKLYKFTQNYILKTSDDLEIIDEYLQICSLLRGGIAERGGVRVGHRIIEINGQSVVAVPHERIVNLLATSVGEVRQSTKVSSSDSALSPQPQFSSGFLFVTGDFGLSCDCVVCFRSTWRRCQHPCTDCWLDRRVRLTYNLEWRLPMKLNINILSYNGPRSFENIAYIILHIYTNRK